LDTIKILFHYANQINSTITLYYADYKLNCKCLKTFNSDGNLVSYHSFFEPCIKEMVIDNNMLYYIVKGRRELKSINLQNKENKLIYKKDRIHGLHLKSEYLIAMRNMSIILIDMTSSGKICLIKLEIRPSLFFSITDQISLIINKENVIYEFNIQNQSLKKFSYINKNIMQNNIKVYSYSNEAFILVLEKMYFILNILDRKCIYKSYCEQLNFYINGANNRIISFDYTEDNTLCITEYELIDTSKVINITDIMQHKDKDFRLYQFHLTKNFLIKPFCCKDIYYYNFYKNKAEKIFETKSTRIIPLTRFSIGYYNDKDIIIYKNIV
jgi:hypothetical protein